MKALIHCTNLMTSDSILGYCYSVISLQLMCMNYTCRFLSHVSLSLRIESQHIVMYTLIIQYREVPALTMATVIGQACLAKLGVFLFLLTKSNFLAVNFTYLGHNSIILLIWISL